MTRNTYIKYIHELSKLLKNIIRKNILFITLINIWKVAESLVMDFHKTGRPCGRPIRIKCAQYE